MRKYILWAAFAFTACNTGTRPPAATDDTAGNKPAAVAAPAFSADSAYAHIEKQISFGPRIPGTKAQTACAAWLISSLRTLADTVYVQRVNVNTKGKSLPCINIIASFNPAEKRRILLLTHWDTRPVADKDAFNPKKAFDGADDGASGTAVLLEAARHFKARKPGYGIDILFTDVEDYGDDYCLGTQYWARTPHLPGYTAAYGILLDMVGARNAHFYMEGTSQQFASAQMKLFWDVANQLGYSGYFRYETPGNGPFYIEDDHTYVNNILKVPTFDIIATQPSGELMPHHHTANDNISVIDRRTLAAVGQPLLSLLYGEPFKY